MKINTLLLVTALTLSSALRAESVPETKALSVARNFFDGGKAASASSNYGQNAPSSSALRLVWTGGDAVRTKAGDLAPAFYVYARSGGGFVIVAGDDTVTPILGYSKDGEFKTEGMPENVSFWFSQLRDFIRSGVSQGLEATDRTKEEWADLERVGETASVVVYIQTPSWDQGSPYNGQCPMDGGKRSYTGCVATAMAEILRTISYPSSGTGTVPAYVTDTRRISVPDHTLGELYDWNQMPMQYSSKWTQDQESQVARLMYDCGTSVQMDYTSSGSGAYSEDVAGALRTYFKIDSGVNYRRASLYKSDWEQMLRNQLDEGYPLYYSAATSDYSGHAFVLDGYDSDGRFHINFGWSGSADGYMAYPEFNGGGYSFTYYHDAIFGIKPSPDEPEESGVMFFKRSSSFDDGLVSSVCDFVIGEQFTIKANGLLYNAGNGRFCGKVGIARVNSSGVFQEIISSVKTYSALSCGVGDKNLSFDCTLTELNGGDRAKLFSMSDGDGSWTEVECSDERDFCTSVSLEQRIDLSSNTSLSFDRRNRILSVSTLSEAEFSMKGPSGTVEFEKSGGSVTVRTADLPSGSYTITIVYRTQSKTFIVKL